MRKVYAWTLPRVRISASPVPADILISPRRHAYQTLLMRAFPAALRAYPQAIFSFVQIDFSEIHGRRIVEAPDCGNHFQIISMSVLARHEIPTRDAVMDEAIRLRTSIRCRLPGVFPAVGKALLQPHLYVVLVTKCAKCLAWLACRHTISFNDTLQQLKSRLRNTLVPSNFRNPTPVPVLLRLRRSGVKCLFREKMRKTQQHNVNKARIYLS